MRSLRNGLALLFIAFISSYAVQAQHPCPDYMVGLEHQHAKLLDSEKTDHQKQALENIVTLTNRCNGAVTFWSLLPRVVEMYADTDAEGQTLVLDAIHAINNAYALNHIKGRVRSSRAQAQIDTLWTRLLDRHKGGVATRM